MSDAANKILFLLIVPVIFIAGCMVGPDYKRPQTAASLYDYYFSSDIADDINDPNIYKGWWNGFGDKLTSELVQQALENNYDIKAAAARVLQAQASLKESQGLFWPDVSYLLSRSRNKNSFNFGGERFSALTTTYSQQISISYIVDLFGELRRSERAYWAELLASQQNQNAIINSLIATVVSARIQIATIQRQLELSRANTENRQQTLEIVERRYSQGLASPVDVYLARENLASSQAGEIIFERALKEAYHSLDVLLGRRPGLSDEFPATLAELPDLRPVPLGMPAYLLDRRADVKASEFALRAASERIGVSIAQLYPDLTITAGIGRSADQWHDIWKDETEIYSLVFGAAQPIFKGGQLRARVDRAKARYQELAANYANTVLIALREVEDVLTAEHLQQQQLEYTLLQYEHANNAEDLSRERYQRGVENILTVLESERRRRTAEIALTVLKGNIWTTRVNLYLAMGGDWL